MRHTLDIYLRLLSIQVRSQMQYRISFLMDAFTTGFLNGTYFFALAMVLERFGGVKGWGVGEVAFLAGMAEMSFGMMDMIFSGFDPDFFSPMVRLGRFDQLLLRPINISFQVLGSSFKLRRLGRVFEGLVIFILALALNPVRWTLGKALYLPVVLASQVIAFGSLFIAGSALIFWTVERIEAVNIFTYGGNELITYPMTIYPAWLRRVVMYALPLLFLNYAPALYFLEMPDPLHLPAFAPFLSPFVALAMLGAALTFWRFGLRHYQSTGS